MDFMIIFLDSVCYSVSSSGESWNAQFSAESVRLSSSLPPSNDRANGHQSTHNITTKFLSAEERFMFRIWMLLPRPVPLHLSANTVATVSQRVGVESGRTNARGERERTETWNQVSSFFSVPSI